MKAEKHASQRASIYTARTALSTVIDDANIVCAKDWGTDSPQAFQRVFLDQIWGQKDELPFDSVTLWGAIASGESDGVDQSDRKIMYWILLAMLCCDALRAINSGEQDRVWPFTFAATRIVSILERDQYAIEHHGRISSKGGKASNEENRSIRDQVIEYYKEHEDEFRSIDHAAESIAGKIAPVAFTTVRAYINAWRRSR